MKRQLRLLALYCLFIALECVHGAVVAAVTNTASVSYTDTKSATGTGTKTSNEVKAVLPETISYYTSVNYDVPAKVTQTGDRLFVQATSPECNTDPNAVETITIAIASRLVGDTENYRATETEANSGVFRINSTVFADEASSIKRATGCCKVKAGASMDAWGRQRHWHQGRHATTLCMSPTMTPSPPRSSAAAPVQSTSILIDPSRVSFSTASTGKVAGRARPSVTDRRDRRRQWRHARRRRHRVFAPSMASPRLSKHRSSPAPTAATASRCVGASLYKLVVKVAPTNYAFPSQGRDRAKLSGGYTHEAMPGSFGGEFVVSSFTGAVIVDFPLDTDHRRFVPGKEPPPVQHRRSGRFRRLHGESAQHRRTAVLTGVIRRPMNLPAGFSAWRQARCGSTAWPSPDPPMASRGPVAATST